ncbi:phage tail length tape measure family protein [Devosia sp. Root436]|uniref:phage tail length tape measure family protein n=1 Tax=Devosia sp. Root436 TaxID=1736537 RepID=UPI00138F0E41|nr:phage tail length tape measure family protein [Devosia sp. Root436]
MADNSNAVAGLKETRREIEMLATSSISAASGKGLSADLDRMFGISGNNAFKTTRDDIAAMGQQLDTLRAQYNPVFAAEQAHETNLAGIQRAYRLGAISADEMSLAIDREKMAHTSAIAALDGHTGAMMRNNRAAAQRTNLLFQLQDIGVSLASGMNPLMVAAQQGSQISMIYGPEEGGLGKALSETGKMAGGLVSKLGPLALVIGGGALSIAGIRHEIEETSGVAVGFGDVLAAVFQVPAAAIYEQFKPALDAVASWWSDEWDLFVQQTKEGGNFIVRETIGMVDIVGTIVMSIPDAFTAAGEAAAEGFANAIIFGFREVQVAYNSLITDINGLASQAGMGQDLFPTMNLMEYVDVDFGGDAAVARLTEGWGALNTRLQEVAETDYMGQFFGAVQTQAIANYNAGLEETGDAAGAAAQGVKIAKDAMADFNREMDFYKSTFSGFVTDIFKGLREGGNAWEVFGNAAVSALDKIADRAVAASPDGEWDTLNTLAGDQRP